MWFINWLIWSTYLLFPEACNWTVALSVLSSLWSVMFTVISLAVLATLSLLKILLLHFTLSLIPWSLGLLLEIFLKSFTRAFFIGAKYSILRAKLLFSKFSDFGRWGFPKLLLTLSSVSAWNRLNYFWITYCVLYKPFCSKNLSNCSFLTFLTLDLNF